MDLYLVRLKKFEIYALANGMDEAYQKVRQKLDEKDDEKDYGFSGDRELVGVDVVAKNWSTNGYINWSENKAIVV